ncbi:MAG TPA: c-type cytochrome [Anaerolineae bacterium]|jgi:cytochrome c2
MSIIKKIVTFKPSFNLRVIVGLISVVGFLSACAIVGLGDLTKALGAQDAKFSARSIEAGARVYFDQCARCHGADGKGIDGQGPALSSIAFLGKSEGGREVQKSQRIQDIGWVGNLDGYIRAVTASGIPLKSSNQWEVTHPAFGQAYGGNLRDDQISDVSKFILNWQQNPATSGTIDSPKPGAAFVAKATAIPLTPEQEAGKAVFMKNGCNACHAIKGVAQGTIGPNLSTIGTDAATIITAADYKASKGKATTAEEFLIESIVDPGAYIAPKCPQGACLANVMPANFKTTIPDADLKSLVAYLLSLK